MVADNAGKTIYIAEATAGQVAVFDVAGRKVTGTIAIGQPVSGAALSPDKARLYVTAGGAEGRLCVVDVKTATVTARIRVALGFLCHRSDAPSMLALSRPSHPGRRFALPCP